MTIYRNIDTKTKYLRENERGRKKFANTKLTVCRERVKKNKLNIWRERERERLCKGKPERKWNACKNKEGKM